MRMREGQKVRRNKNLAGGTRGEGEGRCGIGSSSANKFNIIYCVYAHGHEIALFHSILRNFQTVGFVRGFSRRCITLHNWF